MGHEISSSKLLSNDFEMEIIGMAIWFLSHFVSFLWLKQNMLEILPLNTTTSFSKEAIKNEKKQIEIIL